MSLYNEIEQRLKNIYRLTPEQVKDTCMSCEYTSPNSQFYLDGKWWDSALHCYYYTKFPEDTNIGMSLKKIKSKLGNKNNTLWNSIKIPIMRRILYSKFEQNIQYFKILMGLHDSAINSIDEEFDGISIKNILFHIRTYYIKNGHPLMAPRNSRMTDNISKKYQDWKKGVNWKKRTV